MIVDEFKSAETTPPTPPVMPPQQDPWEDWQPQWQKKRKQSASVHEQQESHSPTQPAAQSTIQPTLPPASGGARQRSCPQTPQRRILDARLWEALTPAQQNAAQQIARDYDVMSRGLGYSNSDWTRARRWQCGRHARHGGQQLY